MENNSDFKFSRKKLVKYTGESANVVIPEGTKEIAQFAFWKNETVREVIIPESVEKIGYWAFCTGENLEHVVIKGKPVLENAALCAEKLTTAGPIGSGCAIEFAYGERIPGGFLRFVHKLILPEKLVRFDPEAVNELPDDIEIVCPGKSYSALPTKVKEIIAWKWLCGTYEAEEAQKKLIISLIKRTKEKVYVKVLDAQEGEIMANFLDLVAPAAEVIEQWIQSALKAECAEINAALLEYKANHYPTDVVIRKEQDEFEISEISENEEITETEQSTEKKQTAECKIEMDTQSDSSTAPKNDKKAKSVSSIENVQKHTIERDVIDEQDVVDGMVIRGDQLVEYTGEEENVLIPEGIRMINQGCFSNNKSMTSVTLPSSIEEIGCNAFEKCSKLTSVKFNGSVTKIDYLAFAECIKLKELRIPDTAQSIHDAFYKCKQLKKIYLGAESVLSPNDLWCAADVIYDRPSGVSETTPDLSVNLGDTISMGMIKKDQVDTKLVWKVIGVESEKALLLLETELWDRNGLYWEGKITTWEKSVIRGWLNHTFASMAFSKEEMGRIQLVHNTNEKNSTYAVPGGKDTDDYLFLLSEREVKKYLPKASDRVYEHNWWLRTPGEKGDEGMLVLSKGALRNDYSYRTGRTYIRPAIWVKTS